MRTWGHTERFRRAWEREHQRMGTTGRASSSIAIATRQDGEPPPAESESLLRLWWQKPDRLREERDQGPGLWTRVVDGPRWWSYSPSMGALSNEGDPEMGGGPETPAAPLLDPAAILASVELEARGPAEWIGRRALRARALPRAMSPFDPSHLPRGADAHDLLVDAERGVLLRLAALIDGEEFSVQEVVEIAFDEIIPSETFSFSPPAGEEVRAVGRPSVRQATLDEAAREMPFGPLVHGP